VVVAHPERNNAVQEYPEALRAPVEAGAVVQLTAASLDGRLGRAAADCSRRLLDLELAHLVATDVHADGRRPAGLAHVARAVGDEPLARWLTEAVPAALLAGEPLPARPASAPPAKASRGLFRRRPRR
jgi:protein-tyrosine phosphatase